MTRVISTRIPSALDHAIRANAYRSRMLPSVIVRLILEYSLCGHYNFTELQDAQEFLGSKLDIRLPDELVSNLHTRSDRLRVSVSVYIRTILYSYYSTRLVFVEKEGNYRLEKKAEAL